VNRLLKVLALSRSAYCNIRTRDGDEQKFNVIWRLAVGSRSDGSEAIVSK